MKILAFDEARAMPCPKCGEGSLAALLYLAQYSEHPDGAVALERPRGEEEKNDGN